MSLQRARTAIDPTVSRSIEIARVLCIFFMIYVHVNPGVAEFDPAGRGVSAFDWTRLMIVDSLGRASVALLSIVSGYLSFRSLARTPFPRFAGRRARALLVPMAIWSALFIALAVMGEQVSPGYAEKTLGGPLDLWRLPSLLLGLLSAPANLPLAFLRDIFVCSLLAPGLVIALRRGYGLFAALVLGLYLAGIFTPLFLTPNLLAYYALGLLVAQTGWSTRIDPAIEIAAWVLFALMGWAIAILHVRIIANPAPGLEVWSEVWLTVIRLPAAIAFWTLSMRLSRSHLGARIAAIEPYIFTAFCAHMIVLTVAWFAWQQVLGTYYAPAYPVFFFLGPVYAIVCGVVIAEAGTRISPTLFGIVNGGRSLKTSRKLAGPGLNQGPASPSGSG